METNKKRYFPFSINMSEDFGLSKLYMMLLEQSHTVSNAMITSLLDHGMSKC